MRNFIGGIAIAVILFGIFQYCEERKEEKVGLVASSKLIETQINNVSKLIVTEGHFSEIYNYEDSKNLFRDYFTSTKRALVTVNTEVLVSYDLNEIEIEVISDQQTVSLKKIPEPQIKLIPNIQYYDVEDGIFNEFEAEDYNKIQMQVEKEMQVKLANSSLVTNAQNRLLSELQKIWVLTNSQGWQLVYEEEKIQDLNELNTVFNKIKE